MDCAGQIDSLVELLQGKLSKSVMERICRQQTGLFPTPAEITLRCSCLGPRVDVQACRRRTLRRRRAVGPQPELLFDLRAVKQQDLLAAVEDAAPVTEAPRGRILGGDDLSALFGIEMAGAAEVGSQATPRAPAQTVAPPRRAMAASAPSGVKRARPAASSIKAAVAGKDIAAQLAASNGLSKKESKSLLPTSPR